MYTAAVFTANAILIMSALNMLYILRKLPCFSSGTIFQSFNRVSSGCSAALATEGMFSIRALPDGCFSSVCVLLSCPHRRLPQ